MLLSFVFISLSLFRSLICPDIDCMLLPRKSCETLDVLRSDSTLFLKDYPIILYYAQRSKNNEVFELSDTLSRDTIVVYGAKYTIDGLILSQTDYSGSYNMHCACLTEFKNKKYFILVFFNGYQMGTEQQAIYLLFQVDNNNAMFHASYVENLNYPSSKIRIITKKKGIFLKSKNIDRFK